MKRLTFDVGPAIDEVLTELSKAKGTTKAEVIRRALASYAYLTRQAAEGKSVCVMGENERRDVVLP
jgi:hypothetical protein